MAPFPSASASSGLQYHHRNPSRHTALADQRARLAAEAGPPPPPPATITAAAAGPRRPPLPQLGRRAAPRPPPPIHPLPQRPPPPPPSHSEPKERPPPPPPSVSAFVCPHSHFHGFCSACPDRRDTPPAPMDDRPRSHSHGRGRRSSQDVRSALPGHRATAATTICPQDLLLAPDAGRSLSQRRPGLVRPQEGAASLLATGPPGPPGPAGPAGPPGHARRTTTNTAVSGGRRLTAPAPVQHKAAPQTSQTPVGGRTARGSTSSSSSSSSSSSGSASLFDLDAAQPPMGRPEPDSAYGGLPPTTSSPFSPFHPDGSSLLSLAAPPQPPFHRADVAAAAALVFKQEPLEQEQQLPLHLIPFFHADDDDAAATIKLEPAVDLFAWGPYNHASSFLGADVFVSQPPPPPPPPLAPPPAVASSSVPHAWSGLSADFQQSIQPMEGTGVFPSGLSLSQQQQQQHQQQQQQQADTQFDPSALLPGTAFPHEAAAAAAAAAAYGAEQAYLHSLSMSPSLSFASSSASASASMSMSLSLSTSASAAHDGATSGVASSSSAGTSFASAHDGGWMPSRACTTQNSELPLFAPNRMPMALQSNGPSSSSSSPSPSPPPSPSSPSSSSDSDSDRGDRDEGHPTTADKGKQRADDPAALLQADARGGWPSKRVRADDEDADDTDDAAGSTSSGRRAKRPRCEGPPPTQRDTGDWRFWFSLVGEARRWQEAHPHEPMPQDLLDLLAVHDGHSHAGPSSSAGRFPAGHPGGHDGTVSPRHLDLGGSAAGAADPDPGPYPFYPLEPQPQLLLKQEDDALHPQRLLPIEEEEEEARALNEEEDGEASQPSRLLAEYGRLTPEGAYYFGAAVGSAQPPLENPILQPLMSLPYQQQRGGLVGVGVGAGAGVDDGRSPRSATEASMLFSHPPLLDDEQLQAQLQAQLRQEQCQQQQREQQQHHHPHPRTEEQRFHALQDAQEKRRAADEGERRAKDELLLRLKDKGLTYREIRVRGQFAEAESTLRGRYRTLTKAKHDRVRKPAWTDNDDRLLLKAVHTLARGRRMGEFKVSWKAVADDIKDNGGSYHFGNTTCRKRFDYLTQHAAGEAADAAEAAEAAELAEAAEAEAAAYSFVPPCPESRETRGRLGWGGRV